MELRAELDENGAKEIARYMYGMKKRKVFVIAMAFAVFMTGAGITAVMKWEGLALIAAIIILYYVTRYRYEKKNAAIFAANAVNGKNIFTYDLDLGGMKMRSAGDHRVKTYPYADLSAYMVTKNYALLLTEDGEILPLNRKEAEEKNAAAYIRSRNAAVKIK